MASTHIPAWKRLGLKLKNTNGNIPAPSTGTTVNPEGRKRKDTSNIHASSGEPQLKKTRINSHSSISSHASEHEDAQETISDDVTRQPKRKKSVTFTSDTKLDDGDTAQTVPVDISDLTSSMSAAPIKQKAKKAKAKTKTTQKAKPGNAEAVQVPLKTRNALEYLELHFGRRHLFWKFNKNRDIWIRKNAFSIEGIPLNMNVQLAVYLSTIESQAAKQSLLTQAQEEAKKLRASAEWPVFEESLRTDTRWATLRANLENTTLNANSEPDYRYWINCQPRALLVWVALSDLGVDRLLDHVDEAGRPDRIKTTGHDTGAGTKPRVKKSKARTSRVDVSSSSSSSESDSDSPSSGSAAGGKHHTVTRSRKDDTAVADKTDNSSYTSTSGESSEDDSTTSSDSDSSSDAGDSDSD